MLEVRTDLLHLLPRLRRFCIALLGNRDAADEFLVERMQTFVRQRRRRSGGDLRISLFRSIVDDYRVRGRSTRLIGITRLPRRHRVEPHGNGDEVTPGALADGVNGTAFAQALRELNPEDRAALLLKDLEEMTYGDAARVMGKPVDEVRVRRSRAHHALMCMMSGISGAAGGGPDGAAVVDLHRTR